MAEPKEWSPKMDENQIRGVIDQYAKFPELFNDRDDDLESLEEHAYYYKIPFARSKEHQDGYLTRMIKQAGRGWAEGFSTLPMEKVDDFIGTDIGGAPEDTHEAIARNLGHLAGFVGYLPGAKALKFLGARKIAAGFQAIKGKSAPMLAANFAQKKVGNVIEPFIKDLPDWATTGVFADATQGAFHLGTASAVSSWTHGVDEMFHAAGFGAGAGAVFRGIGNLKGFGERLQPSQLKPNGSPNMKLLSEGQKADLAARTMAGAAFQGLPSTIQGATTEEQVYAYAMGAFFGYKEMPYQTRTSREFLHESIKNDNGPDPEMNPRWGKMTKEMKDVIKTDFREFFGEAESQHLVYDLIKGKVDLTDIEKLAEEYRTGMEIDPVTGEVYSKSLTKQEIAEYKEAFIKDPRYDESQDLDMHIQDIVDIPGRLIGKGGYIEQVFPDITPVDRIKLADNIYKKWSGLHNGNTKKPKQGAEQEIVKHIEAETGRKLDENEVGWWKRWAENVRKKQWVEQIEIKDGEVGMLNGKTNSVGNKKDLSQQKMIIEEIYERNYESLYGTKPQQEWFRVLDHVIWKDKEYDLGRAETNIARQQEVEIRLNPELDGMKRNEIKKAAEANAERIMAESYRKLHDKMREDGYYYYGGKGDAKKMYFVKLHPLIENNPKLVGKLAKESLKQFRLAQNKKFPDRVTKNQEAYSESYIRWKNRPENVALSDTKAQKIYKEMYVSNMLYELSNNGYEVTDVPSFGKNFAKVLDGGKYINDPKAFNKRAQIWFNSGLSANPREIEAYLKERGVNDLQGTGNSQKKFRVGLFSEADSRFEQDKIKLSDGAEAYLEASDGAILAREEVIDALNWDKGLPTDGKFNKSFIVSKDPKLGALLGKYGMQLATPELSAYMKKRGIHMLIPDSAAKQVGERKQWVGELDLVPDLINKDMKIDFTGTLFNVPIRDFRTVMSEITTQKYLKKVQLPKQMYSVLSAFGYKNINRESIMEMYDTLSNRAIMGTEEGKAVLAEYKNNKSKENIKRVVDNIEEIPINELFDILRSPNNPELSHKIYEKIMKLNHEYVASLAEEGEMSRNEMDRYKEGVADFESVVERLNRVFPEGSVGAYMHKFSRDYRMQAMRNYVVQKITKPKIDNSASSRMRPWEVGLQLPNKKTSELRDNQNIFFLDNNFRDLVIRDSMFKKGRITLGELWDTRADYKGALKEKVDDILMGTVMRVPMDSISGAHSLEFAGFTGVKGYGSLLHPRSMKALGGADLDGDKALIFFGGESHGFRKSWREMYASQKNEYVDKATNMEKHNKNAEDPMDGLTYGEKLAMRDPELQAKSVHQTSQYSPYWREFMSSGAYQGREHLGTAVTQRMAILGAYNSLREAGNNYNYDKVRIRDNQGNDVLDKNGKPIFENVIMGKDFYSVPYYDSYANGGKGQLRRILFETKNTEQDLQRFREMSRAAIALGSDPMDEMGIRGEKFGPMILDTLFKYKVFDVVKGKTVMTEGSKAETSAVNAGRADYLKKKGLHSTFNELNRLLYGKNHNDNRRWNYSEIAGGVEKFNYMPSEAKTTFLPMLSKSMRGIDWSDNVFRRVNEGKLNQIYFDHREAVGKSDWLKDAMGRETMSTVMGNFIKRIYDKKLYTKEGLEALANSEKDFVEFISEMQVTKLGLEKPVMGQIPRSFQPIRQFDYNYRRAYLENLVLKGEDFLINDISDMASLKSITDVVNRGKIPSERISEIHDKVDDIKNQSVWKAKERRSLDNVLNVTDADAKQSKAVKQAREAFGIDDKGSAKIDQVQTDQLIRDYKIKLSQPEKDLFDMLYIGTYSKGNKKKLEAAIELSHIPNRRRDAEFLFKMLRNTSLMRAGLSSKEISDASLKEFFNNYEALMKRTNLELTESQKKILTREVTPEDVTSYRDEAGNIVKNELIDGQNLSETDRLYLDDIAPFVGLQEGKIKDPVLKQTYYNLKEHLDHYHNLDVRNLNGLFRGLFKKNLNQANKMDLQTLDRYLMDMRTGTWFQKTMDWMTGKSKNPEIKRAYYWMFPKAINRDLMREPAMMEWVEDVGPYKDKLGNTIENARTVRPTAVIGEIQQLSARTQELSMQTFENEVGEFRDALRPYVSALKDGDVLFQIAVAQRELGYMRNKLRPRLKGSSSKLTEAEMPYIENWNAVKGTYDKIKGEQYVIPLEGGNVKMTGEQVVNKINNIITRANTVTHRWLQGNQESVNKWLKLSEDKNGNVTWKGLDKLRVKFHDYVNDTVRRNKSIPIEELGIDGIRQIAKRILISQTPFRLRNPKSLAEQRRNLEIASFDPTGDLGAEYYYPHMSFNRKLADKKLRSAIKRVVEDSTLTPEEITREVKKINYQYKQLTGDFMAKDEMGENFDIMQEALVEQASKKKLKEKTILGSNLKKVGNQFSREAHIGGWDLNPEAYESYMKNAINTFYKQAMQVTARTAMHNFNNTFYRTTKDGDLTGAWMNFFKLYTQSAMGYPTHIPEKVMNDPKMKIKGTAYKWLADSTAKKRIDYMKKRLGVGRKELEKWNLDETVIDELSGTEYTQLQGWGALEAKWQLASLLAHPKSSIANLYGGTVHTWISAGYDNLKKARDFNYLRTNINPKWKSMKDVEKWMQELGIIEEFLIHEAGLNPQLKSKKTQAFVSDAIKKIKRDPNMSDESLLQLSKKYGLTDRAFAAASSFMRVPERILRRDSFMAHYLQAKNKFGGAIKDYNSPFLINMAKRGVKGTQFLYSAPYRPLWTNSTLGRVFSRFQLWSWNSVRFRNDVIRRAYIAGFQEGTPEFETFKRLAVADLFMLGMANMFQYSLFENALPAPWNWFQDTADWLMGDEEARERAFYGSAIGPVQAVTPPALRLLPPMFKWMMSDDASELTDYYLWTIPPFGRLARDIVGPGGMLENPYYSITKFTGMPVMQAAKLIKGEKPKARRGKFDYSEEIEEDANA